MFFTLFKAISDRLWLKSVDSAIISQKLDETLAESEIELQNHNLENDVVPTTEELPAGNFFSKKGIITSLDGEHGFIDRVHSFKVSMATNVRLSLNQTVSYLAYMSNGQMKISKIESTLNEQWDSVPTAEELEQIRNQVPQMFQTIKIVKMGVVTSVRAGNISVDADGEPFDFRLEDVQTTFKPRKGDKVKLMVNSKRDDGFVSGCGISVNIESIEPSLVKKVEGEVTSVELNDHGIINRKYFFTWDALHREYRNVNVNDKVIAECIDCELFTINGIGCSSRCLNVVLKEASANHTLESVSNSTKQNVEEMNKHGIIVQDNISVELQEYNETKEFTIIVHNTSDNTHKVLSSVFIGSKSDSQLTLISPTRDASFFLNPGEKKEYKFKARGKFFGSATEQFCIKFGRFGEDSSSFRITRLIEVVLEDVKNMHPSIGTGSNVHKNYGYTKSVFMRDRRGIIPGVPVKKAPNFVKTKFQEYNVPPYLKNILLGNNTRSNINDTLDSAMTCFKESLSLANYTTVFHNLLYFEETELYHGMRKYDRPKVFFTHENEYLALKVDNIAETRPSLVLGDSVIINNPWMPDDQNNQYRGMIHKVLHNRVLIKFNENFHAKYRNEDYNVVFEFSRRSLMKQHHAIDKVKKKFDSNLLFPNRIYKKERQVDIDLRNDGELYRSDNHVPWFNQSLNIVQKKAITNILQGTSRPMPYVIFGPPGTGKTLTLIEAILQINKQISHSRIMVATPSNSSADLITQRIIDSGVLRQGEFIRLVGENAVEREQIPINILPYCGTIDIAREGTTKDECKTTESGLQMNCNFKYLAQRRILIGTCVTLGTLMQCDIPDDYFTHVIIDESGQCMETEIVIPLSFVERDTGQIILAGDPMQLGPIVLSRFAASRGLERSLLVRIMDRVPYQSDDELYENRYNPALITRLIYNYRSLPSIMKIYSDLFYDSDLKAMISDVDSVESQNIKKMAEILPNYGERMENQGVIFVGVEGKSEQCYDSPSWFNKAEANSVFQFLIKLYKLGFRSEDIGIITPYIQQVKNIRMFLSEYDLVLPKIGTVEEFQGQERQIILVSTVRSQYGQLKNDDIYSLGFVKSEKRMNVAISRARSLLVVFGSPKLLSKDENWKFLIKKCVENKCAVNVDPAIVNMNANTHEDEE